LIIWLWLNFVFCHPDALPHIPCQPAGALTAQSVLADSYYTLAACGEGLMQLETFNLFCGIETNLLFTRMSLRLTSRATERARERKSSLEKLVSILLDKIYDKKVEKVFE